MQRGVGCALQEVQEAGPKGAEAVALAEVSERVDLFRESEAQCFGSEERGL